MREPERRDDDGLSAALRQALPAPPTDAVDWSTLQRRIDARAAPLLAGRRTLRPGVWQTLAGWAARAIPLTAAAAAVALLVLGTGVGRGPADEAAAGTYATVEDALTDGLAAGSAPLLMAGATDDDMAGALLFYDERER